MTIAYRLLQWSWGLPQNLAGLLISLFWGRNTGLPDFCGARVRRHRCPFLATDCCFSLGMFLFIGADIGYRELKPLLVHEFGHSIQSLLLGPLYLPLIFLPSLIHFHLYHKKKDHRRYCDHWPENTANFWGHLATGEEPINW